jgi:glucoamylase
MHPQRTILASVAAAMSLVAAAGVSAQGAPGTAPGAPGEKHTWATGDKDGFGTSAPTDSNTTSASKVWYTLNDGTLTEVYYPRIDTPSTRDTQLVVTDGRTFTDREDVDTTHRVQLLDDHALVYRQVDTDLDGKYRITKTYTTDPARSAVLVDVQVESLTGSALQVFVLHDPALSNGGDDDTGGSTADGALVADDGTNAVAVTTEGGFNRTSSGYQGTSDGWTDLASDHAMNWTYTAPQPGNVVQVGRVGANGLPGNQRFTLSVGFGKDRASAASTARTALTGGFASALSGYTAGWHGYLASLDPAPASVSGYQSDYWVSAMVLAASEDKTVRGGYVAAPGRPWAWANSLQDLAVYHAVWSRDLYQIATALLAVGDEDGANRALDFLWTVQQRPDGSFPQNSNLDGKPIFGGLQMDEVAFPIVLDWQLHRFGDSDWDHVRRSASFLVANGPRTPQERWENIGGYSPATIAAEIAGLVCAADIAEEHGATKLARQYRTTADRWEANLDTWTRTTNGPLDKQPYYLRITDDGNAHAGTQVQISDGGPLIDQRRVVDPSFLDTVRLGVRRADDPDIVNTNEVVDRELSYDTGNGRFWHRASFDGYGERPSGTQWEPVDPGSHATIGRGWPLLGGERGEYALLAGQPGQAQSLLDTMSRAADDQSLLMSEQVWDHNPPADETSPPFVPGEPTFSATPLAWTHAQFLRLASSIDAGAPVETPQVVACRYGSEACRR